MNVKRLISRQIECLMTLRTLVLFFGYTLTTGCIAGWREQPPLLPLDTVLQIRVDHLVNVDFGMCAYDVVVTNTSSNTVRINAISVMIAMIRTVLTDPKDESFTLEQVQAPGLFSYSHDDRVIFTDPVQPKQEIRLRGAMPVSYMYNGREGTSLNYSISWNVEVCDVSYRRFSTVPIRGNGRVTVGSSSADSGEDQAGGSGVIQKAPIKPARNRE